MGVSYSGDIFVGRFEVRARGGWGCSLGVAVLAALLDAGLLGPVTLTAE